MATWRKVIVSGSNAELNHISSSGNFVPVTTDGGSLGTSTLNWSDLFLDSGAVVNFDNGDVTLTHASNKLTVDGGDVVLGSGFDISGSFTSTGSFGRLELSGDAVINGNLTFGDADTDSVSFGADITSDLVPNASDSHNLGSEDKKWDTLFLSGSLSASGGPHRIESATTIDLDAEGALTLDGGSITIGGDSDVAIDIDSSTLDIDASNAITIDGTSTFSLDVAGNTNIDTSTGAISIGTANSGIAVNIGHTTSEVTVNDNWTVTGNATVGGDLDVNGTLTTIDTTNLRIKDQFVLVASGSTTGDGGIIANTTADGSGSALFYDHSSIRWGLARSGSAGHTQTAVTTHQFVVSVSGSAVSPDGTPNDFGGSDATRIGMMHVNTDNGEIWIYS